MALRALGRCSRRHAQVVDYPDGTMPAGVCAWQPKGKDGKVYGEACGEQLIEWATKAAAPGKAQSA